MKVPPDEAIAKALTAIVGSPEFQAKPSDWLTEKIEEAFRALGHWLRDLPRGERWLLLAGCTLALAALFTHLIWTLRQAGKGVERRRRERESRPPKAARPSEVLSLARRLVSEGRLRDAARALQQALLLELADRNGLAWRPEVSDWEWVAILPSDPRLAEFTRAIQSVAYGPAAELAEFESCERLFAEIAAP